MQKKQQKVRENCNLQGVVLSIFNNEKNKCEQAELAMPVQDDRELEPFAAQEIRKVEKPEPKDCWFCSCGA